MPTLDTEAFDFENGQHRRKVWPEETDVAKQMPSGGRWLWPDALACVGERREAAAMLQVYTYKNCDTCRRATKWLRAHAFAFVEKPIRDTPPTAPELQAMLKAQGGELRKLFNTSGSDYREQRVGEKLPNLTVAEAIALLTANGNLVKRPFLLGDGVALVGFDEATWTRACLRTA